jgi:hypothetical protein
LGYPFAENHCQQDTYFDGFWHLNWFWLVCHNQLKPFWRCLNGQKTLSEFTNSVLPNYHDFRIFDT